MKNDRTHDSKADFFPSKRDVWLGLLIWVPIIGVVPLLFLGTVRDALIILAIVLPTYAFVAWLWFGTGYTVTTEQLLVKSGPLRWRINLSDISHIKETRNPLASAALSMDRLELRYARFGKIFISPLEKERFLALMQEKCPDAEIVRRQAQK